MSVSSLGAFTGLYRLYPLRQLKGKYEELSLHPIRKCIK